MRDGDGAIKHVVRMVGFELFRPEDSTRVLTGSVKIGARPDEEDGKAAAGAPNLSPTFKVLIVLNMVPF